MAKVYYEKDADLNLLKNKTVAVIGYGNQGRAQAQNLRDSGVKVIVGARKGDSAWSAAEKDGFKVMGIPEAAKGADIIHILLPDEVQGEVYVKDIGPYLKKGKAISFSHGFSIRFKQIVPPKGIDVFMVAPKGVGRMVREAYTNGFGVPAVIAVHQDYTGKAKQLAFAFAKGLGCTRAGVIETTFAEETETDLFSEQADLCGGVSEMVLASFETLVKNGYQPEVAYFETLHELKLITDLIHTGGLEGMWERVSNTAEYGGRTRSKLIITEESRRNMQKILEDVKSGKFAREWVAESKAGMPNLKRMREEGKKHQIEVVGARLRKMFERK